MGKEPAVIAVCVPCGLQSCLMIFKETVRSLDEDEWAADPT